MRKEEFYQFDQTTIADEDKYPILATLRRLGRPATRENYLAIAGWDDPDPEISAEEEFDLPPKLRKL